MSIITFCSNGKGETGQTLSAVATAIYMALEHNQKILLISTSYKNNTMRNAFLGNELMRRNIFANGSNVAMQNGIDGLNTIMRSNKVTPEIISNYNRIILKDRLELLLGSNATSEEYEQIIPNYPQIIEFADRAYDIVIVDLDRELGQEVKQQILNISSIIVANMSQRIGNIISLQQYINNNLKDSKQKIIYNVGRYDENIRYTAKNISRTLLKQKEVIQTTPYNTSFFEACEEGKAVNIFIYLKKINENEKGNPNATFKKGVKGLADKLIYKLEELKMKK